MIKRSAGILLFRRNDGSVRVLLIHPGGPYWRRKDEGAWSIPEGLFDEGEEPLSAAKREFLEETGTALQGAFIELGEFRQPSGKRLTVWALEGDFDLASFKKQYISNGVAAEVWSLRRFPKSCPRGMVRCWKRYA